MAMTREEVKVVLGVDSTAMAPGIDKAKTKIRSFSDTVKKDARGMATSFKDLAVSIASGNISMETAARQIPALLTGFSSMGGAIGAVGVAVTALGFGINALVNDLFDVTNKAGREFERTRNFWHKMRKEADAQRAEEKAAVKKYNEEMESIQRKTLENQQATEKEYNPTSDYDRRMELKRNISFLKGATKPGVSLGGMDDAQDQLRLSEYELELAKIETRLNKGREEYKQSVLKQSMQSVTAPGIGSGFIQSSLDGVDKSPKVINDPITTKAMEQLLKNMAGGNLKVTISNMD